MRPTLALRTLVAVGSAPAGAHRKDEVQMRAQQRSVGDLLRSYRLAAGLSQTELAERAGLSRRGISDIERGDIQAPHRDTLARLADALELAAAERDAFHAAARGMLIQRVAEPHRLQSDTRLAQPPLVGRADELALIERHLAGTAAPLLVLAGEPGIGKSRLLAETAWRAAAQGWRVFAGGCTRRSGQEPYAPFVDMLARSIATRSPAQQRQDLRGCSWLARLVPELAERRAVPVPEWSLPAEQERRLIFAAVAHYLGNVAGPSGTLLLLDDLQWAGQDVLDLLADLVRSLDQMPLRLLGTCRDTELHPDDPLPMLVADLAPSGLAARHQVGPLSHAEASELAMALLGRPQRGQVGPQANADLAAQLAERTGGRPYYLLSCTLALQAGRKESDGSSEPTPGREIPWTVVASLRQRIALLPETAQEVLGVAAVAGRHAPRTLLMQVGAQLGRAESALLAALEATDRTGLLLEASSDTYEFAHDLVREVVATDLSAARRAALHRRVGDALEGLPAHRRAPAELAWHFKEAGEIARALPYMLVAGDQARATSAFTEAEQQYRAALEGAQELGDQTRAAEALEGLLSVQLSLARFGEALATIEGALLAYEALGDVEGQARLAAEALRAHISLATFDAGVARFGPLIEDLRARGLSESGQARLYSALADLLAHGAWYEAGEGAMRRLSEALMTAEYAMALARAAGDDGALAYAMLGRGLALTYLNRLEEALDVIEGALPLTEANDDLRLIPVALMAAQAGREIHGDFELSQRHLDRALAVSGRVGYPALAAFVWHNQAELAYYRGDWALARTAIERSLEIAQTYDLGMNYLQAQLYLAHLYLAAGEQKRAEALIAAPLAEAVERRDLEELRMAYALMAERDLLAGPAEAVRAYLEPLLDRVGLEEMEALFVLPHYAWALLALGDEENAEVRALQSCDRARTHHYPLWLVDGLWVLAMVRIRQARWEEACALLEEAIAQCRTMPYPYAEIKALYVYGQLHVAVGEPRQARKKYEAALSICDRLGEGLYRPHIERALTALGA
jgi:transcriptional regulator with XRE-family HTH domain